MTTVSASKRLCNNPRLRWHNRYWMTIGEEGQSIQGRTALLGGAFGTKPERLVAAILTRLGVRFKRNVRTLPGTPDFVLVGKQKIILVHGCFWHRHGCKKSSTPKTNTSFWIRKFARNVIRDRKVKAILKKRGWSVLILWECKMADRKSLIGLLRRFISGQILSGSPDTPLPVKSRRA